MSEGGRCVHPPPPPTYTHTHQRVSLAEVPFVTLLIIDFGPSATHESGLQVTTSLAARGFWWHKTTS